MKISGIIDGFLSEPFSLNGWAKASDSSSLLIEARLDGEPIAATNTTIFREDIGGEYGFRLQIPGEILDICKNILSDRIKLYAISSSENSQLEFYKPFHNKLLRRICKLTIESMPPEEIEQLKKELSIPKTQAQSAKENIIDGAGNQPLSYFGLKPGLISENGVSIVGKDGMMFILKGNNDLISMYGEDANSEKTIQHAHDWVNLFEKRDVEFKKRNTLYRQIIIPEKSSIAPELFPIKIPNKTPVLDLIEKEIEANSGMSLNYIPIQSEIESNPKKLEFLRQIDSHWTPYGTLRKFQLILKSIGIKSDDDFIFDRQAFFPGDLGGAFTGSFFREPLSFPATAPFKPLEESLELIVKHEPPNGGHVGCKYVWQNKTAVTPLRVIAFGNSFFERGNNAACLSWWAARWFQEFHFLWYPEIDYDYVDHIKPDIVICQTIERFLPRLPKT